MTKSSTRQKVMDAACLLFYTKGYTGTSVRDIAAKAKVNVSLISYHFTNKQGLLEHLMVQYFEPYIELLEEQQNMDQRFSSQERLRKMIEVIIQYKKQHHQFTCFIHRELTLDNVLVREMMVTYLAKEKYILFKLFKESLKHTRVKQMQLQHLFLQFKGMLMMPFLMPYEMREHVLWDQSPEFFVKQYTETIMHWLEHVYQSGGLPPKKESIM
ncbi:forespore capture DNA-binding protein RefZ [Pontibacillus salipaludis]|uniref:TetR family transcriptional regulator n=1 Tax=Pontibacillus salipaludis TaxID=1697394 RepID=A0ABQ1Q8V6_9BACI|nr:forespore capture DNA-binding protein RefZ [Pontibacillus salipaludis]GGD17133.1 TetR family transcriptional regulator [Pontibacillus salipaludis]